MISFAYFFSDAVLLLSFFLGFIRFIKGPTTLDRILSFDLMGICIIGVVILFSLQGQSSYYLEILLIFCLLGFVTTLAFMDALFRRKKGENE